MTTTARRARSASAIPAKARKNSRKPAVVAEVPAIDPVAVTTKAMAKADKSAKAKTAAKVGKTAKAKEPKAPRAKLTGYSIRKDGSMSARDLTCLCGCGAPTVTNDARFISGHDAKLRQRVLSGEETANLDSLPAIIRPFFEHGEVIAGLRYDAAEDALVNIKGE